MTCLVVGLWQLDRIRDLAAEERVPSDKGKRDVCQQLVLALAAQAVVELVVEPNPVERVDDARQCFGIRSRRREVVLEAAYTEEEISPRALCLRSVASLP